MIELALSAMRHVGADLAGALQVLLIVAAVFVALAVLVKGRAAFTDARRAAGEMRLNLLIHVFDVVLVGPVVALVIAALSYGFDTTGFRLLDASHWERLPSVVVAFLAVFAGDFIGYWRHRLEHTRVLWPSHAVHHSDADVSWLTSFRIHPINRLSTAFIDLGFLLALGFPPDALLASVLIRHYNAFLIHADLPWTYGPLRWILVSPVMHQWHHARDPAAYGTNFATVFSVFDLAFGTFYMPGRVPSGLGVDNVTGKNVLSQLAYPFRRSSYQSAPLPESQTGAVTGRPEAV